MHEQLRLGSEVVVDDVVEQRNINTARRDIRHEHDVDLLRAKFGEVDFARGGVKLAVHGNGGDVECSQQLVQILDVVSRGGEHDRLLIGRDVLAQQHQ